MIKEEILIDGINVNECKYFHYKGCTANNFGSCNSSSDIYKNCYFKQLKRLEQENKELKEKQIINDIDKLDGMVKIKGKCGYEFIGGCRELKKYKQALEEIAKETKDCKNYCNSFTTIEQIVNEVLNVETK